MCENTIMLAIIKLISWSRTNHCWEKGLSLQRRLFLLSDALCTGQFQIQLKTTIKKVGEQEEIGSQRFVDYITTSKEIYLTQCYQLVSLLTVLQQYFYHKTSTCWNHFGSSDALIHSYIRKLCFCLSYFAETCHARPCHVQNL